MKRKIKTKLRVGDEVIVITGKNKGQRGKIISFHAKRDAAYVDGVNMVKKALKKTEQNKVGGFSSQESAIHISNIMYYLSSASSGVRLGYSKQDKKRERIFKIPQSKTQAAPKKLEAAEPKKLEEKK